MHLKPFVLAITILLLTACSVSKNAGHASLKEVRGTYSSPPRLDNGHVDQEKLLRELKDINANTYNWLIWTSDYDWEDLKKFLPMARKNKINVWVSLVPPSESKPIAKHSSEPFGMDYKKWAAEIAELSKKHPNLVAWSIDDFAHNLKTYTPAYVKEMLEGAEKIDPSLAFIPCVYYKQITPEFAKNYGMLIHGILFPYRAESVGANLQNATRVVDELKYVKEVFDNRLPVFIDIYATAHSRLGASTPEYVRDVIKESKQLADGILIYTHQDPLKNERKYNFIKQGFSE